MDNIKANRTKQIKTTTVIKTHPIEEHLSVPTTKQITVRTF